VFRQSHVGRLGAYPLMAAAQGVIGLATADSGRSAKAVAPFGGREARLGTNPISIEVPSDLEAPFYLDMATSAVAAGKVALAVARGKEIPTGWIVDKDGRETTDPTQLRKGGALLPMGGSEGYKGSGLAAIVEVLCGILTGLGFGVEPSGPSPRWQGRSFPVRPPSTDRRPGDRRGFGETPSRQRHCSSSPSRWSAASPAD